MVELTYPAVETEEERAKVVSETLVASKIFNPKNLTSDFPNVGVRSVDLSLSLSLSVRPVAREIDGALRKTWRTVEEKREQRSGRAAGKRCTA